MHLTTTFYVSLPFSLRRTPYVLFHLHLSLSSSPFQAHKHAYSQAARPSCWTGEFSAGDSKLFLFLVVDGTVIVRGNKP